MSKRYGYITPEDYETAEANGISYTTLWKRVNDSGWDIDRAITTKVVKQKRLSDELKERLHRNGITVGAYRTRIRRGMSVSEASTMPVLSRNEIVKRSANKRRIHSVEDVEEAERNGISYHTFCARIRDRGWSVFDAKTKPTMTQGEILESMHKATPWADIITMQCNENMQRMNEHK